MIFNEVNMIPANKFKGVVEHTPLVSIDFIVKNGNKVLLGKRVNKPACGYYFSIGGRIYKNETLKEAMSRIVKDELGIELTQEPRFLGVFEHFYEDGFFENVSTHYVNLGYEIEVQNITDIPKEQHSEYRWFDVEELLKSDAVHRYVKDYFKIGDK